MGDASVVRLRDLAFRQDGSQWIVGRPDGDAFVAVPYEGVRAIGLLSAGATVEETERRLRAETGADLDVRGFVRALGELGFLEEPGGPAAPPRRRPFRGCAPARAVSCTGWSTCWSPA